MEKNPYSDKTKTKSDLPYQAKELHRKIINHSQRFGARWNIKAKDLINGVIDSWRQESFLRFLGIYPLLVFSGAHGKIVQICNGSLHMHILRSVSIYIALGINFTLERTQMWKIRHHVVLPICTSHSLSSLNWSIVRTVRINDPMCFRLLIPIWNSRDLCSGTSYTCLLSNGNKTSR